MDDKTKTYPGETGGGGTPWFLKLTFLAFILWAVYYLWKNVQPG